LSVRIASGLITTPARIKKHSRTAWNLPNFASIAKKGPCTKKPNKIRQGGFLAFKKILIGIR
jgi:hypothetical protein